MKIVLKIELDDTKKKTRAMKTVAVIAGVESILLNAKDNTLTVIGEGIDGLEVAKKLRKLCYTEILAVGPTKEPDKETDLWGDNIMKNKYETNPTNVPESSSKSLHVRKTKALIWAQLSEHITSLFTGFKTKLLASTSEPISVEDLDLPESSALTEEGPTKLNDPESPTKFPAPEDTSSAVTQDILEVRLDFLKTDGTLFDILELLWLLKMAGYKLLKSKFVEVVNLKVIHIRNFRNSKILDNLSFPDLEMLVLQPDIDLSYIPSSFFDMMPALKVLDMSHTNIKTLPNWIYQLTKLEELILRHCELLIELPHEVSKLGSLKVLDLEGTDLVCLPEELKELNNLKCLKFTLYDADSYRKSKNIAAIIPRGTLSKLTQLEELSINVDPQDVWCGAAMEAVMEDLPSLRNLKILKLYLPTAKLFQDLLGLKGENDMPIYQTLSDFNFIIGPRAQHFISRLSRDLEKEFLKLKKCLKYINGEDSTLKLAEALKHANALYLDRHWTLQKLSVFKFEDLTKLKFCLLVDCNEMQTLFDGSDFNLGVANNEDKLHPLQYLAIHYLRKLEVIWKGPGVGCCLHSLKVLVVNTCPNLTTIFTPVLLRDLVNLREIQVENCPKITTLIAEDQSHSTSKGILPRLQKLSLFYLPELVSIFNDLSMVPELENIEIYDCPKLEKLPSVVVGNKEVIQVKGESEWWDALRWNESERSDGQPYYPLAFSDSDIDEDFPQRCGNSLRHFVEECSSSLQGKDELTVGKAKLKIINSATAPVDENNLRVLLELTGLGNSKERLGLDLVTILDVSGSMRGDRLEKLKKAMQFMIKKLSPIDRLSIITFCSQAHKLCGLQVVNETSREEIIDLVMQLRAEGETNITDGLRMALEVLEGRRHKDGRSVGIMLMSDGEQNKGGDPREVEIGSVPVYTFGFGTASNRDPKKMADVLNGIAKNSKGGTFSDVPKTDGLGVAFAQCLAGLLTLVVEDLELVILPENKSKVESVSAGDYAQSRNTTTEPAVTVHFGNLYDKETRKIIVDLVLPRVEKEESSQVLQISYKYLNSTKTRELQSPPIFASIKRIGKSTPVQKEEVTVEASRIDTANKMKEARILADQELYDAAKNKLVEAENLLEDVEINGVNTLIEALKAELQQFLILLQSPETYKKRGRAYALAAELSHERQRHAAKGDALTTTPAMYATRRMEEYKKQSELYAQGKPVPTADEDAKEEALADPIGPISGALSLQI